MVELTTSSRSSADLLAYTDDWTAVPGETMKFRVHCGLSAYQADIVRLIHGDPSPDGPGVKELFVQDATNGWRPGQPQAVTPGSYVIVRDSLSLQRLRSFSLVAWIYPTMARRKRRQGLLSKWSPVEQRGFIFALDGDGSLVLLLGSNHGIQEVRGDGPLVSDEWYFVSAIYDSLRGRVRLGQDMRAGARRIAVGEVRGSESCFTNNWPLLMAAVSRESESRDDEPIAATDFYNGKIGNPALFSRPLSLSELTALRDGFQPTTLSAGDVVAHWDFSADISSSRVIDISVNSLDGITVNLPARAVTGSAWSTTEVDWRRAPHEYAAIHFHEDDLEDVSWPVAFEVALPENLRSGVYAARLRSRCGGGDVKSYVPFFVGPGTRGRQSEIALIIPTFTYLAYSNERVFTRPDVVGERKVNLSPIDHVRSDHPEFGGSLYDVHVDGSGCCYVSRRRPILNLDPSYRSWVTEAARHLMADLYLVDWLEEKGFAYDVLTDDLLHAKGTPLLSDYRVVLTGSHPEYVTEKMIIALEEYRDSGGRIMYLGGNGFYMVTSVSTEKPHCIEVRRGHAGTRLWESAPGENHHSFTGELGGLWRYRGFSPQRLVGVGYTADGWGGASGYLRREGALNGRASFVFEGVPPDEVIGDFGLCMGGAAGDEMDRYDAGLGTPSGAIWLASASNQTGCYQEVVEDMRFVGDVDRGRIRADMVLFETAAGGAVFSVGSMCWCGSLSHNNYENNVSQVTSNVLNAFLG